MFIRGGVYRVVKEAMGSTLAKLSVSALMFDYILTGPTSGVSAGQYIAGLANELLKVMHSPFALPPDVAAAVAGDRDHDLFLVAKHPRHRGVVAARPSRSCG